MSSYKQAINCFAENRNGTDAAASPEQWNLNSGLLSLSSGIEEDLAQVKVLLKKILEEIESRH
ncbi:MAG: hypothetical protein ABSH05_14325 [Bryobacteraceae bacterium]|jgi:hypothetical protein